VHKKFQIRRYLVALFTGIFAVAGLIVAVDAPARAASQGSTSTTDYTGVFNSANAQYYSGTNFDLDQSSGAFTAEAWVRDTSTTAGTRVIFGQGDSSSNRFQFGTTSVTGDSTRREVSWVYRGSVSTLYASGTGVFIPVDAWTHLAFVSTATTVKIYVNGQSAKEFSVADTTNILGTFYVGRSYYNNDSHWQGDIDELRVWAGDQSANIASRMHTYVPLDSTDLRAYFDFNEGSGTSIYNRVNDAALAASASSPTFRTIENVTKANGKTVVTFPRSYLTSTGGWKVPTGATKAEVFAVGGGAGGGGGGYGSSPYVGGGGGGGAGGQVNTSQISLTSGATHSVQVGQGGLGGIQGVNGGSWGGSPGKSGGDSKFGSSITAKRGFGGWGAGLSDSTRTTGRTLTSDYNPETEPAVTNQYQDQNGGQGGQSGTTRGSLGYGSAQATPGAGGGGAGSAGAGTVATSASAFGTGGAGTAFLGSTYGAGANGGVANSGAAVTAASVNSGNGGVGGNGSTSGGIATAGASGGSGIVIVAYAPVDDTAFDFSGENRLVAAAKDVIPNLSSFTFETWLNPDSLSETSWNDLFRQQTSGTNYGAFGVGVYCGYIQVIYYPSSGGGFNTAPTCNPNPSANPLLAIKAGEWTHISVTISYAAGSPANYTLNVYVNGVSAMTTQSTSTSGTLYSIGSAELSIGGYYTTTSDRNWNGKLDQIKVWNGVLSQAEILKSMHAYGSEGVVATSGSSLRAHFDFNSTDTALVKDQTGNGYDFTLKSGATAPTIYQVAQQNEFAGSTIYKFERSYLTPWGGWVTPSGLTGTATLLALGGGGSGGTRHAGGGGAGELVYSTSLALTSGNVVAAKVGQGGMGQPGGSNRNDNSLSSAGRVGQSSKFGTLEALGGGGGEGGPKPATAGGSSGGRDEPGTVVSVGPGSGSQNTGAEGIYINSNTGLAGGGGGGAGSSGYVGTNAAGGKGGDGIEYSISGTAVCYAAGGGGGVSDATATGGPGGDGCATAAPSGGAGSSKANATSALANTGSGGGGGGFDPGTAKIEYDSGSGGSGVIIVSVKTSNTVTFNPNSGTGSMANQAIEVAASANLTSNAFVRSGYTFKGWSTTANGTVAYTNGQSVTPTTDLTLYAVWVKQVLYYNFSDRDSTHGGTTAVTNLADSATLAGTKVNAPTHNYANGTLNLTGTTYANGSYVDVADINSAQFSAGITVDFEADFGATQENWERIFDFGVSGPTSSNILVSRLGTSSDLVFEIYDGATSQGSCKVVNGIPTAAQMIRWTFTLDGTDCKVWKDGVAQATSTAVYPGYTYSVSSSFAKLPATNVTWGSAYIGKSNWSADTAAQMALRSIRLYAGALTPDQVGAITYRTVNFDGNYTGAGAISSRYTSGKTTLQDAPSRGTSYIFSGWYDSIASASGTLFGTAGDVYSPTTTPINLYAAWSAGLPKVNVAFDELNFDFSNVVHVVGTNGKAQGNKVLFLNVTTKGGVQVDALVTTETLSSATIANYEANTGAGGANSYFQTDVDISAANGFAKFKFDFYQHGAAGSAGNPCTTSNTSCTGATKVSLQNVNVSAIDIDYYQWNDFTAVESYAVAGNSQTKLKECVIPGTGTCTARVAPSTFPADMRFQGSPDTARTNDPVDMAIVTYAEIETFSIKFGRSAAGKPNYFGVAFKALSWGVQTPASVGGTSYTINYNGNGSTVGNNPTANTGVVGANITLPGAGTLTKTGYTFAGWNTAADGTGTTYAAGNVIQMPQGGMTLYAKWTANQYMLIYKLYGGVNGPATEMRYTGATANLSGVQPTRDGAVFSHWNTNADNTGTDYDPSASFTMPGANTTLHAIYTTATGTIAYSANNGSSAPTGSTGTSGTTTTAAAAGSMNRTNYTFSGWNTAADGSGTDYTVGATFTYPANGVTTTLYAQWTPVLYSYTYNANGGSGAPTGGSTTAGSTVNIASSTTTRDGYIFDGWTTSADGTGAVYTNGSGTTSFTMPGANTVLYAKWTAVTYTLTFNSNDAGAGANPTAATGTYGATLNVAAAPSAPTGKKFNGWNTLQNGNGSTYAASSTYQITANTTLWAQWVLDNVNLFYSANGGSGAPTSVTATANQNTTLSGTAPDRTGFDFSGWTTAQNGTGTVYGVSSSFPLGNTDTTLYAKWTPIGYNFIYNANGGSGAPVTVAYNMGQFVVINSGGTTERTGYTFAGWNTLADGTGSDYVGGQNFLMSNSNMTMYAKWTSNPYTLTYNGNGGTGSPVPETRNAGAVANLSATVPTRDGYTFNGWNSALNGSGTNYAASASFTMPTSNSTIYAQWVLNSNAVSYNANNGSGAPSVGTYGYAATVTVSSATPTRVGYTFLGWNTQADGNGTNYAAADTFSMPNSSVVLYARWAVQQKTFTYDANGGAGVDAAANYNYGATVTVTSSQPTRSGYSFIGWNSMADGSGTASAAASTFTMPAADVTVYAIWSVNAYTVYYNMNGGSGSINPQPGTYGTNVTVSSTAPTRTGYTFSGWNTLADGTGSDHTGGGTLTIPSSNVTLYAKWTAIQYSISYNANGGSGSPADATALTAGTNTTLSATSPNKDGYVFNGWNTAANGSGQTYAGGQSYVVPAANTVLFAQWVANTYEVIYNANGGTGAPAAENGSTGQDITLSSTAPTRPGYNFVRWNTDVTDVATNSRKSPGGTFNVPAGNTILYAIWELANITLTYNINGGTGTAPETVTDKFMATVTLAPSTAFSRSGYTFNGWNTAADGSGASYAAESNFVLPDANEELFAQWSQVFYAVEYNTNGGSNAPANQFAAPGANVAIAPTEPTKAGYEFDDWTSAGAGTTITPGATLTMPASNVVLVANWVTRASVPTGQNNGGVASPSPSPSGTPSPSATPAPKQLKQTVYFKGDSAVLQPLAKSQLRAVAKKAKANGTAAKIQVFGRVKETNDKSYDLRLSKARANNVAKYLKSLGVKGVWVITAAGISPENKAISRRVDLYMNWK
jgi:uncharacterized repeat protein (TIGR02543 family)